MDDALEALADDLQRVLEGSLHAEDFRTRNPMAGQTGELGKVLSFVEHYLDDEDIRRRDAGYRIMQDAEMEKLVLALRLGRLNDAAKITFLGRSK